MLKFFSMASNRFSRGCAHLLSLPQFHTYSIFFHLIVYHPSNVWALCNSHIAHHGFSSARVPAYITELILFRSSLFRDSSQSLKKQNKTLCTILSKQVKGGDFLYLLISDPPRGKGDPLTSNTRIHELLKLYINPEPSVSFLEIPFVWLAGFSGYLVYAD